jgi:hypothetical protein
VHLTNIALYDTIFPMTPSELITEKSPVMHSKDFTTSLLINPTSILGFPAYTYPFSSMNESSLIVNFIFFNDANVTTPLVLMIPSQS